MNHRVVAIIKGGLGNQLFSYAAARAFALRTGRTLFIDDDAGFVHDGYGRSFRLNHFPIEAEPAPAGLRLGDPKKLRHKWVRSIDRLKPVHRQCYVKERAGKPATQLTEFHSDAPLVHLNGYWQSEAYFADAAETIRRELTPPVVDDSLESELEQSPSVFVHVRRVHYSPALPADYYRNAIEHITQAIDSPRFEVFGDDLAWAKHHLEFGGHAVRWHEDEAFDELRDYRLMSSCRHAIVANSSFSWWGAWIRPSERGLVCTPQNPGWPVKPAKGWTVVDHGELEYE